MIPTVDQATNYFAERTKGLSILGSTGSIGTQTLDIVRLFPDRFAVEVLTAGSNAELLAQQALEFQPARVVIGNESRLSFLQEQLAGTGIAIEAGEEALCRAAALDTVDLVVAAVVGFAGLAPVLAAIEAEKTVALANKETLVVGGELIRGLLQQKDTVLIPVDSEHSAIFQCLVGEKESSVEQLVLTASGGPFRSRSAETFEKITRSEALDHPNWSMGAKITIDSATMMNKGLEVIEARWLFDLRAGQIDILVHPQSIVHSMVNFCDGSVKAQLGVPDMKVPIQYALTFPERWPASHKRIDWRKTRELSFERPDQEKFPCIRLAYEALEVGGTAPAMLNAANEEAVALFLNEAIGFMDIPRCIEQTLEQVSSGRADSLEALQAADAKARETVRELCAPLTN